MTDLEREVIEQLVLACAAAIGGLRSCTQVPEKLIAEIEWAKNAGHKILFPLED
jgi:hypothetical protein